MHEILSFEYEASEDLGRVGVWSQLRTMVSNYSHMHHFCWPAFGVNCGRWFRIILICITFAGGSE